MAARALVIVLGSVGLAGAAVVGTVLGRRKRVSDPLAARAATNGAYPGSGNQAPPPPPPGTASGWGPPGTRGTKEFPWPLGTVSYTVGPNGSPVFDSKGGGNILDRAGDAIDARVRGDIDNPTQGAHDVETISAML